MNAVMDIGTYGGMGLCLTDTSEQATCLLTAGVVIKPALMMRADATSVVMGTISRVVFDPMVLGYVKGRFSLAITGLSNAICVCMPMLVAKADSFSRSPLRAASAA